MILISYYTWLITAWVGAWLLHERIHALAQSPLADIAYWTVAKIVVWLMPIVLIVRLRLNEPLREYLALYRGRRPITIGVLIGLAFVGLSAVVDLATGRLGAPSLTIGLANALVIAPLFEEVVFRGFVFSSLVRSGCGEWLANGLAAVAFLGLHLPGWYFMGASQLTQPIALLSIVAIGLVAGYGRIRSGSTSASIAVHFVNNAYSMFLR